METNNNDTQNKQSVLITGGCGGVASASAALFLKRGAQVLLTDINEERLKKTVEKLSSLPGELRSLVSDVSKVADCEAAISYSVKNFGQFGCLNQYRRCMGGRRQCLDDRSGMELGHRCQP